MVYLLFTVDSGYVKKKRLSKWGTRKISETQHCFALPECIWTIYLKTDLTSYQVDVTESFECAVGILRRSHKTSLGIVFYKIIGCAYFCIHICKALVRVCGDRLVYFCSHCCTDLAPPQWQWLIYPRQASSPQAVGGRWCSRMNSHKVCNVVPGCISATWATPALSGSRPACIC